VERCVVNARLSPLSHVCPEVLQKTFEELSKDTDFKDIKLRITPLEIEVFCKDCQRILKVSEAILNCPYCGSADLDIQIDREFFVESIELEEKRGLNGGFKQIDEARKILGLEKGATLEEIREAYRRLSLKYHPDRCKGLIKNIVKRWSRR
jgi:Zn finger protein HypA/HybF involved in hydrogenase expression